MIDGKARQRSARGMVCLLSAAVLVVPLFQSRRLSSQDNSSAYPALAHLTEGSADTVHARNAIAFSGRDTLSGKFAGSSQLSLSSTPSSQAPQPNQGERTPCEQRYSY
jgi:hypothetical protein